MRHKSLKFILVGFVAIPIAAVIVIFTQFHRKLEQTKPPVSPVAEKTLMSLDKVRQTATKDGAVQWELDARTAELEAETGLMVLNGLSVRFFLEDGSQVFLTARRGVLDTQKRDIEVTGNVKVENDRYTLLTEMLSYRHETRTLLSDKPVRIVGRSIELRAATMTYELDANRASFEGNVDGNIDEALSL